MEHTHLPDWLWLFAPCRGKPGRLRPLTSAMDAVARILGKRFLTGPHMTAMSQTWLRQHEVEWGKHGEA
jgi:hypothetical protein